MTQVTTGRVSVNLVVPRGGVSLVRIRVEIRIGNAEVGFVRVEIGAAEFQLEILVIGRVRLPRQLEHRLTTGESGFIVDSLQFLEPIGRPVIALHEVTDSPGFGFLFAAVVNVAHQFVEFAVVNLGVGGDLLGDRGGQIVDRATCGVWPVLHLARALDHLQAAHPLQGRAVVGRRGRVRRRGCKDAVLHDGHLRTAAHVDPPQADVREIAVPVLRPDVHPRHPAQRRVDVADGVDTKIVDVQIGGGTGDQVHALLGAHDGAAHQYRIQLPGLLSRSRSHTNRTNPGHNG